VDAQVNLQERGEKGLELIGDKVRLLGLLNIQSSIADELVVAGDWSSVDGIGIHLTSALVPSRRAKELAQQLSQEDPFQAWLPRVEGYEGGGEHSYSEKAYFNPWIVSPSAEARLDETDPLGLTSAVRRPHFTKSINANSSLRAPDPFKRTWVDPDGKVAARSEAWGHNSVLDEDESSSGVRLVCRSNFLKDVLVRRRADLLVLVTLRRYVKGLGSRDSQYFHTTAVIRVTR
jgi:hypothetical protein